MTMETIMNTAVGTAKSAVGSASDVAKNAATATRNTAFDTAKSVMEFVAFLRSIGLNDVLGVVGLARKHSSLPSIALFGGGFVVGAGVGLLFAPASGKETRSFLLSKLGTLGGTVAEQADKVQEKASDLVDKAQDKAHSVADRVEHAVDKVEDKASQVAEEVQDKAGHIVGKVQDKVSHVVGKAHDMAGHGKGETDGEEDIEEGRRGRRARSGHNTHIS